MYKLMDTETSSDNFHRRFVVFASGGAEVSSEKLDLLVASYVRTFTIIIASNVQVRRGVSKDGV